MKLNIRPLVSATFLTLSLLGLASTGIAQSLESLQIPAEPLVLKARGSFYVGGESIEQSRVELGGRGADDRITVNRMYVDYMVPEVRREWPVVATWKDRFDDCNRYIERIKAASGHAEMLRTPAIGIRGNSHMLMHDRNHLQIADLLLKWIADHQPAEVSK